MIKIIKKKKKKKKKKKNILRTGAGLELKVRIF